MRIIEAENLRVSALRYYLRNRRLECGSGKDRLNLRLNASPSTSIQRNCRTPPRRQTAVRTPDATQVSDMIKCSGLVLSIAFSLGAFPRAVFAQPAVDNPSHETHRPFADFGYLPNPNEYSGRVFRLSQRYPATAPSREKLPKFLELDFRKDWKAYILAAREYCFSGNIRGGDVEDDFRVAIDAPDEWFHMPWQHYGPSGREGVHGLTREAPVQPRQLAWTQTSSGQTYAVAFYNAFGGHTIGTVWKNPERPELHDIRFPHGTVVFKLLFVDIPRSEVPSLVNPVIWQAYATETFTATRRKISDLALIQMDLMVRDDRSPLGWIFGTFQYNGDLKRRTPWENLVPIGLQWGNDPTVTDHSVNSSPVSTQRNSLLKETVINDDDAELPPTHLGWGGRLNGPVDNPMSSCMSCHAVAQVREVSPISPLFQAHPPTPGSPEWMRWFRNYKCGERFDAHVPSADFSLQLAISVQNFLKWRGEQRGMSATNFEYQAAKAKASVHDSKFTEPLIENGRPKSVPKIQRNFDP